MADLLGIGGDAMEPQQHHQAVQPGVPGTPVLRQNCHHKLRARIADWWNCSLVPDTVAEGQYWAIIILGVNSNLTLDEQPSALARSHFTMPAQFWSRSLYGLS